MKHIKTFEAHSEQALDIKNEYTKLKNSPKVKTIDLGKVGEVADSNITNIKQTYKDAVVKVIDGHYILMLKENLENISKEEFIFRKERSKEIEKRIELVRSNEQIFWKEDDEILDLLDELKELGFGYDEEKWEIYPELPF